MDRWIDGWIQRERMSMRVDVFKKQEPGGRKENLGMGESGGRGGLGLGS